jgi:hypothetical protein
MLRLAAIASALAVTAGLAAAAELPAISIERTCRAAKPLDAQDTQPVESCVRDEREARSELEVHWAKFGEGHRRLCGCISPACRHRHRARSGNSGSDPLQARPPSSARAG